MSRFKYQSAEENFETEGEILVIFQIFSRKEASQMQKIRLALKKNKYAHDVTNIVMISSKLGYSSALCTSFVGLPSPANHLQTGWLKTAELIFSTILSG